MDKNIIYHKLKELSQLKKFYGIQFNDFKIKYFQQMTSPEFKDQIELLKNEKKIVLFKGKLYPDTWKPSYSSLEIKIFDLLKPNFENGNNINLNYLVKEVSFVTKDSLDILLFKLEYDQKIIKNQKYSYYNFEKYNGYLELVKSLEHFTLSQFRDLSGLSRKESERFLSLLDKQQITSFDGRTRTIKKS